MHSWPRGLENNQMKAAGLADRPLGAADGVDCVTGCSSTVIQSRDPASQIVTSPSLPYSLYCS